MMAKQSSFLLSGLFLVLLLPSDDGQSGDSAFLKILCSRNPSALLGLCTNYTSSIRTCPSTHWGEWKLQDFSPSSASNASCPSASRLFRYNRTKDVSHLSATCKNEAGDIYETQDRCPPTTKAKIAALMQVLGNDFGSFAPPAAVTFTVKPAGGGGGGGGVGWGGWGRRRRSPPPPPSCQYSDPRDLAIVIDSSGSVGSSEFKKAVDTLADFIGFMCHSFECNGPETRLAVVTYGSNVKEVFNFHYSGSTHKSKTQIINDIKTKTTYMNGFTATGPALEYCRDNIFQTSNGMRSNSKRQILVLTDGHSNRGIKPGIVATQLHNQMGVEIYALGIGSGVNIAELKSITKERSQINLLYKLLFVDFSEFSQVSKLVKDDIDSTDKKCKAASKIFDKKK